MAKLLTHQTASSSSLVSPTCRFVIRPSQCHWRQQCRLSTVRTPRKTADFAFAFDIDGVLVRSARPLPRAARSLSFLQSKQIPFILLTNGGGKTEQDRVSELSRNLGVPLDTSMFIQSHTPFAEFAEPTARHAGPLRNKTVLVVGGDQDKCRIVAENYGFARVITPGDILTTFPAIMPFASPQKYQNFSRRLANKRLAAKEESAHSEELLKIDAIMVFNDSRDWVLDIQIILDLLLSHKGYLGTVSDKNGDQSLPNQGYQQDGQPALYFSNPDLLWASDYHLPRLGQGGFKDALEGVWRALTAQSGKSASLEARMFGKPYQGTYEFAENRLRAHRKELSAQSGSGKQQQDLRKVYMVGDNPESDILGANSYRSPHGSQWTSILVRSGVFAGGQPAHPPKVIVDDVWDAVEWAVNDARWQTSS